MGLERVSEDDSQRSGIVLRSFQLLVKSATSESEVFSATVYCFYGPVATARARDVQPPTNLGETNIGHLNLMTITKRNEADARLECGLLAKQQ